MLMLVSFMQGDIVLITENPGGFARGLWFVGYSTHSWLTGLAGAGAGWIIVFTCGLR